MPEDKRPCRETARSVQRRGCTGPPAPPWLWVTPISPEESRNRAEIPPSTSAPRCRALLRCAALESNPQEPRWGSSAALLGGRVPFTGGAGEVCRVFPLSPEHNRTRHSQNDLGDAVHEYACSICQGTRSALVSAAVAGPHHGTACQFSAPEGGGRNKIIQDHLLHANLARITSLSWAERTCGVKCIVEVDLH